MIENELNKLIRSCKKWISACKRNPTKEEHIKQFNTYVALIKVCEAEIKHRKVRTQLQIFAKLSSQLADKTTVEDLTTKIQDTIPDFIPVTKAIVKGCTLTVMNYGCLVLDDRTILEGNTQFFALNNDPIEYLKVPKNCKGKITLYSNWLYRQELPKQFKIQGLANTIETANKRFKVEHHFHVSESGQIQVFKGTVITEHSIIKKPGDILFHVKELETSVDGSAVFSITGGIETNEASLVPSVVKNLIGQELKGKKELLMSFSTALTLIKEESEKINPKSKELIFEKEDQAILSSDQTSVLIQWWRDLNPNLQRAIKNQEAKIEITGFTSETGTDQYNLKLGKRRAQEVGEMLSDIIGEDLKGNSIAIIEPSSHGETSSDPRRYVKIHVIYK